MMRAPAGSPADSSGTRRRPPRGGRNLPAAVAVGLALGAAIVVPLFTVRPAFVVVAVAAVVVGSWEMVHAVDTRAGEARAIAARSVGARARVPLPPLVIGGAAMLVAAWYAGAQALLLGLLITAVVVAVWRLSAAPAGYLRDVRTGVLVAVYVPFLAGFCLLLAVPDDGARRVTTFVATVVCSDVGGYALGSLMGRHPMAPTVSPKKSWEGFLGSTIACLIAGVSFLTLLFPGRGSWGEGAVFGLAVVVAATLGDLGESMIKRDLGVKDMGGLLPGHGGLMDRLDSLLVTAPVAYLMLQAFVPPQ